MKGLPDAIFVIDTGYQHSTVVEANKLGIPVIAVIDTNNSPEGIDYVIPGNDDSTKAIRLYVRAIADAILEGKAQGVQQVVDEIRHESVDFSAKTLNKETQLGEKSVEDTPTQEKVVKEAEVESENQATDNAE